jgi:hypothetical protein
MKKLVFLLIVGIFSMNLVFANAESGLMNPRPDVVITIKLNLHSKKMDCNAGFGFCKITINITFEDNIKPESEMITGKTFMNGQNQLVIKLNEEDLKNYDNGSVFKYFDGKSSIYVDADYEVTRQVYTALGLQKPVTIKAGTYPLSYDQGIYTIVVPQ